MYEEREGGVYLDGSSEYGEGVGQVDGIDELDDVTECFLIFE